MLRDSTEGGLSQSSLVCGLLSNRRIPDRAREAKQDSWRPCEGTHGPSEATHVLGPRGCMRSPGSPCRQSTPYKEARTEAPQGPQQLPRVPALCQARPRCWDPGVSSTPRLCPERACSPSVGETSDFPFVDGSAMLESKRAYCPMGMTEKPSYTLPSLTLANAIWGLYRLS